MLSLVIANGDTGFRMVVVVYVRSESSLLED